MTNYKELRGLLNGGINKHTKLELIGIVESLADKVGSHLEKEARKHVFYHVAHKVLDITSLKDRCQLIVDGLADKLPDNIKKGNNFNFNAIGLYLPNGDKNLELISGYGKNEENIDMNDPRIFKERVKNENDNTKCLEAVIPLIANKVYQGQIIISNKDSGRNIEYKKLFNFFHRYGDMAAGAIYSAVAHEKAVREKEKADWLLEELKGMTDIIIHDLKGPSSIIKMSNNGIENILNDLDMTNKSEDYSSLDKGLNNIKSYVSLITGARERMNSLITELQYLSEIESGYKPKIMSYKINDRISDMLEMLQMKANEKRMRILYSLDPLSKEIKTDPRLFDKIIGNLIINAIDHGEKGTEIELKTKKEEYGIIINVSNEGYIPNTEKIFKRFYSTNKKNGGSGLGVPIIKSSVELLNGYINVHNLTVGDKKKVYFEIKLPQK